MNLARFGPDCRDALLALDRRCRELAAGLAALRSARATDPAALTAHLTEAVALADGVRAHVAAAAERLGAPAPEWSEADELSAVVERFDRALGELSRRDQQKRLFALAGALRAGRFVNPKNGKTLTPYEPVRLAAADELDAGPGVGTPPLPGPADPSEWLAWAWEDPETAEARLNEMLPWAPTLVGLLIETDPTHWAPGVVPPAPEPAPPVTAPPAPPVTEPAPKIEPLPTLSSPPAPPPPAPAAPSGSATKPAPSSAAKWRAKMYSDVLRRKESNGSSPLKTTKAKRATVAPRTDGGAAAAAPRLAPAPEEATCPSELEESGVPVALVVDEFEPEPAPVPLRPAAPEPAPESAVKLAAPDEVAALCASGEYLRAALLCAGRLFAGEPELDPRADALVTAHHVTAPRATQDGRAAPAAVPWPGWCACPAQAGTVAGAAPESARMAFLAARCHAVADGFDPLSGPVAERLLGAFNDLSEVRNWLGLYLEVAAVPGLWDQMCRPAGPGPLEEYRERRRVFATLYESGLQYRNPNVAYVHRQAHMICRKPGAKALFDHVPATGPVPPRPEGRELIEKFLRLEPRAITGDWIATTERAGGGVRLHGNQRGDLVTHAASFLSAASAAWKSARAVLQNPAQEGDLDRRRKQLTDAARAALGRAAGRPWLPLLTRLTQGLPL